MTVPVGIKPQDRLAWHKQLSLDRELSHVAVRVGVVISNFFNNSNGECFVGLQRLADETGVCRATAWSAIQKLVKRQHLRVTKGGGRGKTNTYAMLLNGPAPWTVSPSKPSNSDHLNRLTRNCSPLKSRANSSLTLKDNSKKESEGFSMSKGSPAAGARIGANGRTVLRVGSPQWESWLHYYEASGDMERASLIRHVADNGRRGEWEEPSEWPPSGPSTP